MPKGVRAGTTNVFADLDVPLERLMRLLTRLGCDVAVTLRSRGEAATPPDTIRLQAAIGVMGPQ